MWRKTTYDVIKWKPFPRYWSFVRWIARSPVNPPRKDQWHGALLFSLICAGTNGWVNNRDTGDLRRHRSHYDVTVMICVNTVNISQNPHNRLPIARPWDGGMGVICMHKLWFMFFLSHCSTACNIMLYCVGPRHNGSRLYLETYVKWVIYKNRHWLRQAPEYGGTISVNINRVYMGLLPDT